MAAPFGWVGRLVVTLAVLGCSPKIAKSPKSSGNAPKSLLAKPAGLPRPAPRSIRQLAAGFYHGCALYYDDTVSCWHDHQWDELDGHPSELKAIEGLPAIRSIGLGTYAACALAFDGSVYCFSAPRTLKPEGKAPEGAVRIPLPPSVQVVVSDYAACALSVDGTVSCFGIMLGIRDTFDPPQRVGKPGVLGLNIGGEWALACLTGKVRTVCAAANDNRGGPLVLPVTNAYLLGLGERQGCVLDGSVARCMNLREMSAADWSASANKPIVFPAVPGTEGAKALSVGAEHACVQKADGKILCWGDNAHGQVDPKSRETAIAQPVEVANYPPDYLMTAHTWLTCVTSPKAEHHCWGNCSQLPPLPQLSCQGVGPALVPRDEMQ